LQHVTYNKLHAANSEYSKIYVLVQNFIYS